MEHVSSAGFQTQLSSIQCLSQTIHYVSQWGSTFMRICLITTTSRKQLQVAKVIYAYNIMVYLFILKIMLLNCCRFQFFSSFFNFKWFHKFPSNKVFYKEFSRDQNGGNPKNNTYNQFVRDELNIRVQSRIGMHFQDSISKLAVHLC